MKSKPRITIEISAKTKRIIEKHLLSHPHMITGYIRIWPPPQFKVVVEEGDSE